MATHIHEEWDEFGRLVRQVEEEVLDEPGSPEQLAAVIEQIAPEAVTNLVGARSQVAAIKEALAQLARTHRR